MRYRLNQVYNLDCNKALPDLDDNEFALTIADPPYGIHSGKKTNGFLKPMINTGANEWDIRPGPEYFAQVQRASRNQIIWGAQYFTDMLPAFSQLIVWDKNTGANFFADGEAAFCSIPGTLRIWRHTWCGAVKSSENGEAAIHPTQKPVALYKWLLTKYAKPGDTILDTHAGSGSLFIACLDLGYDYLGFEIKPEYCEDIERRRYQFTRQRYLIR